VNLLTLIFAGAFVGALLAYVPLVLVVHHHVRVIAAKRRPIDEILADAYAEGRITAEDHERMLDEVHRRMPTIDAPYPLVKEYRDL
jgi:uncharacterized membrane protein